MGGKAAGKSWGATGGEIMGSGGYNVRECGHLRGNLWLRGAEGV